MLLFQSDCCVDGGKGNAAVHFVHAIRVVHVYALEPSDEFCPKSRFNRREQTQEPISNARDLAILCAACDARIERD